jgi:uncharacterized damage-inducible protein DinB
MIVKTNLITLLEKLSEVIQKLPDEVYVKNQPLLFQGSIGQHCRHIYEFYEQLSLFDGEGSFSYDERKRDPFLETSRPTLLEKMREVNLRLAKQILPEQFLLSHQINKSNKILIQTTREREYLFLLDHTIHHLAIIRIGIHNLVPNFEIPEEFGYTTSTLLARELKTH